MGHDPPYTPAKFGEDSLKPKKVMVKKHRNLNMKNKKNKNNNNNNNNNNKNIDETLQEQKDIPITWGCPNNNTDEFLQKQKNIPRHGDVLITR